MNLLVYRTSDATDIFAFLNSPRVTLALRKNESPGSQARRICLIVSRGDDVVSVLGGMVDLQPNESYVIAAALVKAAGTVSSTQTRYSFDPIALLDDPISTKNLLRAMTTERHRERLARTLQGGAISPRASDETWSSLLGLSGSSEASLRTLAESAYGGIEIVGAAGAILHQEKDATITALEIFDPGERSHRKRLRTSRHPDSEAPFLARLNDPHQLEDHVIGSDARNFLSWIGRESKHAAAMTFSSGRRSLTVVNANKAGLEKATGADLIYYNTRTDSFVLVQYKMFSRMKSEWRYYPDNQFDEESKRLASIEALAGKTPRDIADHWTYRLGSPVTYFKFCRRDTPFENSDTNLMKGNYIPAEYIGEFITGEALAAGRKSRRIDAKAMKHRSLDSASFTRLVSTGYVGTRGVASSELNRVVHECLLLGHAVVTAIEELLPDAPQKSPEAELLPDLFDSEPF
jgi:hypothetical protein